MAMVIRTTVFPIRMKLRDKAPWELSVEVENQGSDSKVSVSVELPGQVSFSTVGLTNVFEKQYEKFRAGEKVNLKLPVYQSNAADVGYFSGKVIVEEHVHDFGYVGKTYKKEIPFRIVA